MNSTTYVIDTSVLLSAGRTALYSFPESDVVIPLVVLKELEGKRNDPDLGLASRSVLREIDSLRASGDIKTGIKLENGGTIRVEVNNVHYTPDVLSAYPSNDTKIVTVAYNLSKSSKDVCLVSKDVTLKIVASLVGVRTEDFVPVEVSSDYIDTIGAEWVEDDIIDEIHADGSVRLDLDVPRNAAVLLRSEINEKKTALVVAGPEYSFKKIGDTKLKMLDPKGVEQAVAAHYLMNPKIKIVSLGGRAGTGKTTMALAAGVEQVEAGDYKRVTIFRSMHAVGGEELGFLPGTEAEKLDPWLAAIYDSLEGLGMDRHRIAKLKSENKIEVLPLTHIRGRNLSNRFILIDEAQNLTRATIMTALSRSGANTKAVMSWDVSQRDNIRVGRHDGVYEVVSRLMGEKLFAHVSLNKSQRSDVAELVSRKLDDFG